MGEFSKKIGEIGEEIVTEFMASIGWHQPMKNFDIPSIDPDKHGKKSHGIDAYIHYPSPVISRTLENVLISVKYSKDKYPNAPAAKFKDYYKDLGMAIESFKKSELRSKSINNRSNLDASFERGVLFWLNNVDTESEDIVQKLYTIEAPKEFNHDGIFLVDNKKIEFFFNSIEFAKRLYPGRVIEFTYFPTGLNSDNETPANGTVMPVQYLASNVLPMRVNSDSNKNTLILCSRESFEEDELIKLIGLAKNITLNYQSNTIIAFPDYNRVNHEQAVNNAKLIFDDSTFTNSISVESFNSNFRN